MRFVRVPETDTISFAMTVWSPMNIGRRTNRSAKTRTSSVWLNRTQLIRPEQPRADDFKVFKAHKIVFLDPTANCVSAHPNAANRCLPTWS